ncbi:DNA excision repair protein ERCC-4 [Sarotherodon galilaeus]
MSPSSFNFVDAKDKFTASAVQALTGKSIKPLISIFNQIPGNEAEKKTTLDQALRGVLGDLIVEQKARCDDYLALIYLSIDGVTEGICSATAPFVLLGDVLDCLPLDLCDKIFSFVEENVSTWKSNSFYTAGKNYLLRMCNDLLRRLSKSQNTVFCGRIQLFLARLFPLSEKSGLNLQSQFNLDNITVFNKNEQESTLGQKHTEEKEDGMEVEEGEMGEDDGPAPSSIPIDYNLYRKFWTLQDYFRNPVQCYDKFSWMTFLKYSDETLAVFKSYKLDDMQASKRKLEELRASSGEHVYFAKFLTSEKLNVSVRAGFAIEFFATLQLVLCIIAVTDKRRTDVTGSAPLAIGLSVGLGHLTAISFTGCGINPARSFGPALILGKMKNHWVYWLAPMCGGIAASLIYDFLLYPQTRNFRSRIGILVHGPQEEYVERIGEENNSPGPSHWPKQ